MHVQEIHRAGNCLALKVLLLFLYFFLAFGFLEGLLDEASQMPGKLTVQ